MQAALLHVPMAAPGAASSGHCHVCRFQGQSCKNDVALEEWGHGSALCTGSSVIEILRCGPEAP